MDKRYSLNNDTTIMKKTYTAPSSVAIQFYLEGEVAGIGLYSNSNNDPTIDNDNDILSNKRQNNIWGESNHKGMWDEMK